MIYLRSRCCRVLLLWAAMMALGNSAIHAQTSITDTIGISATSEVSTTQVVTDSQVSVPNLIVIRSPPTVFAGVGTTQVTYNFEIANESITTVNNLEVTVETDPTNEWVHVGMNCSEEEGGLRQRCFTPVIPAGSTLIISTTVGLNIDDVSDVQHCLVETTSCSNTQILLQYPSPYKLWLALVEVFDND